MITRGICRAPRRAVALVAATALGAGLLTGGAAPSALASDLLDLCATPVVQETMVSQGLPTYHALARGKSTLVKYYLSMPVGCDPKLQTLTVTGGELVVQPVGGTATKVALPTESHGPVPTFVAAPSSASTGNPTFIVKGTELGPTGAGAPYDVTFTATLQYRVDKYAADGRVTSTARSVTTTATKGTVDSPSNPLRVLVVPMGNKAVKNQSPQFPTDAQSTLDKGMTTLSRLLPVADGAGPLSSTAGVRYELLSETSLIDISHLMTDGKYCGSGRSEHWNYISKQLTDARQKYNDSASAPASLALGVVWEGISSTLDSCVAGSADVKGTVAWSRVGNDPKALVSQTGSLAAHELSHTLGAHPDPTKGFHSLSQQADDSAPDRAHHLLTRAYLAQDEALMLFQDLWHDSNTLAEPEDWLQAACVLAADPMRSLAGKACDTAGDVGATLLAQVQQLHLTGQTDGTPAGTRAHTYVSPGQSLEAVDPASPYQIVWLDAAGVEVPGTRVGVPVVFDHAHHEDGQHVDRRDVGSFDIALRAPAQASAFRFVLAGSPDVVLYDRAKDDRPVLQSVETPSAPASEPVWYAAGPSQDSPYAPPVESALSDNGRLVAWETSDGVLVRRTEDTTSTPLLLSGAADPSFAHTRDALVVTLQNGADVRIISLDTSGQVPAQVGSAQAVYTAPRDLFGNVVAGAAVSSPSFSPDDSSVVVSNGGFLNAELYVISTASPCFLLGAPGCTQLTRDGGANEPSWSGALPGRPQGLIAFTDSTPYDGGSSAVVAVIDPANPLAERTVLYPADHPVKTSSPDFGGGRLAFTELDPSTGDRRVVTVAVGSWDDRRLEREGGQVPSLSGDDALLTYSAEQMLMYFNGEVLELSYTPVLYVAPTVTPTDERVVTASDAEPGELRLDVVAVCPSSTQPVRTGVTPAAVSGGEATFSVTIDTSSLCPGAQLRYDVTDGWQIAEPVVEDVFGASTAGPVVGIALPTDGSTSLQWRSVPLMLTGRDTQGNPLPVSWRLQGPGTDLSGTLPAGERLDLPPLTTPGTYTLTATGTDAVGTHAVTSSFTVLEDKDADGLPASLEEGPAGTCLGANADSDPRTALLDPDGDTLTGPDDPEPCVSFLNVEVDFDANTLNPDSGGNAVTLYVTSSTVDLRKSSASTVSITHLAGRVVDLPALSWSVDRKGKAVAKVERQALQALATSYQLTGYVPVRLTSTAPGAGFAGVDPVDPVFK